MHTPLNIKKTQSIFAFWVSGGSDGSDVLVNGTPVHLALVTEANIPPWLLLSGENTESNFFCQDDVLTPGKAFRDASVVFFQLVLLLVGFGLLLKSQQHPLSVPSMLLIYKNKYPSVLRHCWV